MSSSYTSLPVLLWHYADVFLSVANLRSIAKAAVQLGTSQSAVSQKIALLESKLSVKLFDRSTRPLTLTPEARKLKESLELYNAQISETIQSIQLKNDLLPEIRFGMIHSITDCIGADLIAKLSARTHRVVHLMGTSDALLKRLRNNEVDTIVTSGDLNSETDLIRKEIFQEPLIVAMPVSLRPRDREARSLKSLATCGLPFIRSPINSGSGKSIDNFLDKQGIHLPDRYQIECNLVHLEMIAKGIGWTITYPSSFIKNEDLWPHIYFQYIDGPARTITLAGKKMASRVIFDLLYRECRALLEQSLVPKIISMVPSCNGHIGTPHIK